MKKIMALSILAIISLSACKKSKGKTSEGSIGAGPIASISAVAKPTFKSFYVEKDKSPDVTFSLEAPDATEMYVTNENGCATGGSWEPFATRKTLKIGIPYGKASAYAKVRFGDFESECRRTDFFAGQFFDVPQRSAAFKTLASNHVTGLYSTNKKLFAATWAGLSVSEDNGEVWKTYTGTNAFDVTGVHGITGDDSLIAIWNIVGISISNDEGTTWTNIVKAGDHELTNLRQLLIANKKIYALSDQFLHMSSDEGKTWNTVTMRNEDVDTYTKQILVSDRLYVATNNGLYVSADEGKSWKIFRTTEGLLENDVTWVHASSLGIFVLSNNGISISKDDGVTWTIQKEDALSSGKQIKEFESKLYLVKEYELRISRDKGLTWEADIRAPEQVSFNRNAVHIGESGIYLTSNDGLWISKDGGKTYEVKKSDSPFGGLDDIRSIYAEGTTVYVATSSTFAISSDSGATWQAFNHKTNFPASNITNVNVVDGRIYLSSKTGLFISSDKGVTWVRQGKDTGLPSDDVRHIHIDGNVQYVSTAEGLSISSDGGTTWAHKTTTEGLGNNSVFKVVTSGTSLFAATNWGVSISNDGGTSWKNYLVLDDFDIANHVYGIAVLGDRVVAAADYGLFFSRDRGENYHHGFVAGAHTFDAQTVGDTIIGTNERGIAVTSDGGESFLPKYGICPTNFVCVNASFTVGKTTYIATSFGLYVLNPTIPMN